MIHGYCGDCDENFEIETNTIQTIGQVDDGKLHGKICLCVTCPRCEDEIIWEFK